MFKHSQASSVFEWPWYWEREDRMVWALQVVHSDLAVEHQHSGSVGDSVGIVVIRSYHCADCDEWFLILHAVIVRWTDFWFVFFLGLFLTLLIEIDKNSRVVPVDRMTSCLDL
jgi:hypothetical protein